ncbi:MAG: 4Fe-4S dicluster domain-containing protein [Chloroflexi bacterium]|nr:4Fe-4S dicluster domain-containing protein [Chloroflexota bacterium]
MPTRQIGWNVGEIAYAVMYVLVVVQALFLAYGGTRRYLMWRRGKPYGRIERVGERLREALSVTFLHKRLIRPGYIYGGIMHLFIFYGFIFLFIGTIIVLLEADIARPYFGFSFYQGTFYIVYKVVINLFGLLFIVGLLMAVWRRYVGKLPKFRRSLSDDAIVLGILLFLGLTGFFLQALRLAATHDPAAPIHWVSYPLALALNGMDPNVLQGVHTATWWLHMLANTALLVYIPVSKLTHIFTGPANVFMRAGEPRQALPLIANIEEQEHFGAAKLSDFSWKQLLNFDACMRCGRCLDFCPTFNTGKPLKPRQLVVEIGSYMDRQAGLLAGPAGPRVDEAGVRGSELVATDEPSLRQVPVLADLIGEVVSEDELWDCTTCRACMEQCPVRIEHVPLIVEMRRNLVLEQSRFPAELVSLFNNLERNGNPYSFPASSRADWATAAGVQELAEVQDPSSLEVIYWVGCMSSFDARNQRVATALVRIFKAADVRFAILGKEETCSGDPARRAGNEYLYQVLAQTNIERLQQYQPRRVVASCPHCFNTLKNEYPQLGGNFSVMHHSEFIKELIDSGRLNVPRETLDHQDRYAYHDPCYLGRYNEVYEAPRDVVDAVDGSHVELPRCRDRGFCCGAGGARAFMEEKRGTRISHNRLTEAIDTKASGVAVGCPFCITMFEDGVRALNAEETFAVRDIAELVAERLPD